MLRSLRGCCSWTTLSSVAFILYASYLLSNLAALLHPPAPALRHADGRLKPLLPPLWAAAPSLRFSLRLVGVKLGGDDVEPSLELLSAGGLCHGWSLGGGWDMELRLDVLRAAGGNRSGKVSGLRVSCALDGAGEFSPVCMRLAAAAAAAGRVGAPAAGGAPVGAGAGGAASSLLKRGVLPSAWRALSGVFGGGEGGGEGAGAVALLHDESSAAAAVARALLRGKAVRLVSTLEWEEGEGRGAGRCTGAAAGGGGGSGGGMLSAARRVAAEAWLGAPAVAAAAAAEAEEARALAAATAAIRPASVPGPAKALSASVRMVEPTEYAPLPALRFLWRDLLGAAHDALPLVLGVDLSGEAAAAGAAARVAAGADPAPPAAGALTPHWVGHVDVRLVTDVGAFPRDEPLPPHAAPFFPAVALPGGARAYRPSLAANPVRPTRDRMLPLNATVTWLPLRVTLAAATAGTWNLMRVMDGSISTQHSMGATARDTDDVIRLLNDTPAWMLVLIFGVTFVHLLFDVLALQSDVAFWAGAKSLAGISVRSLSIQAGSQAVITAFLVREGSSLLVTVPQGAFTALSAWKVVRASGWSLGAKWGCVPVLRFNAALAASGSGGAAGRYDREAVNTMVALLAPLCVGAALRSLIYDRHAGWLDWALGTAVAAVYSLGFALMTPQLWLNYRLKSVAHLPWNVLGYRFFNTIIDDVFAAIIKMPLCVSPPAGALQRAFGAH
jgi:hypothetical protein